MTQVLARKWRPRGFQELVGQEHVVRALTNALEQRRIHHAYLFTGTRGVGKTTLARVLAKALNCDTGITPHPCGKCSACVEIDSGRFVDLIELDAASNTQVDNMRELLENALYAPTSGRFKVYIIDEVHMLSKSAFNAMLKTLEEPPEHVKFVLATTDPQKIPVTVLSRCLQFNLKRIPAPLIAERLRHVLHSEGVAFDAPSLALLARAAQGSLRDGLSLLDQAIAHGGGEVREDSVRAMLGTVGRDFVFTVLDALMRRDGAALIRVADELESRSLGFEAALQELATLLHQLALAQTAPEAVAEDLPDRPRVLQLAGGLDAETVQLYYQIALHGRDDLSLAPDEYAGFTMTLMRMLAFAPEGTDAPAGSLGDAQGRPAAAGPSGVKAAASVASYAAAAPAAFDGDWASMVPRLNLSGMAKQLAQHCELKRFGAGQLVLCLPEAHKHLLERSYQERVAAAVGERLGKPVRVRFEIGGGSGMTPAEIGDRERREQQVRAVQAIEADPFVRDLIENFDARLNDSSIKPLQ